MTADMATRDVLLRAFPGLIPEQADEIIASGQVRAYPAGAVLCEEDQFQSIFYVLLSGEVKVTKRIQFDEQRLLKLLGPGSFFGEMAIIHNAPRAATVVATQPSTVLEIRRESFTGLLETSQTVSLAIIREVSRRLRENDTLAIEDLRLKARELAEAYQQLAEEEFARNQFLTTIAHELRTPLMAANGYLQIIRLGMMKGEQMQGALDTIWRSLQEVTSLTNDILFLQEMELIMPEFQPTNLVKVLEAAIAQEQSLAQRIPVYMRLEAAPNLPEIMGDPKSLQRALAAIIDNAIKFSPDGGEVLVKVWEADRQISLSIQDFGVGIPPEAMPRIFQRFFHMDVICGRMFRGIGLGLSIAKHVIEQHGGAIRVESELQKGSTFTITLTAGPVQ
jgi:signal transduction histidine kinase